ncbi:hypothetical protein GCM10017750_23930 [Streptomyces racemochromogenes]
MRRGAGAGPPGIRAPQRVQIPDQGRGYPHERSTKSTYGAPRRDRSLRAPHFSASDGRLGLVRGGFDVGGSSDAALKVLRKRSQLVDAAANGTVTADQVARAHPAVKAGVQRVAW